MTQMYTQAKKNVENDIGCTDIFFQSGEICFVKKDYAKALEFYKKSLDYNHNAFNKNDSRIEHLYLRIGHTFELTENYGEAIKFFEEIVNMKYKEQYIDAPNQTILLQIFQKLGDLYERQGEYEYAVKYYHEYSLMVESFVNQPSLNDEEKKRRLDYISNTTAENPKLKYFLKKMIDIKLAIENNELIYLANSNLEKAKYAISLEEAKQFLFESLEIKQTVLGESHPEVGKIYKKLSCLFQSHKDKENSLYYDLKCSEIFLKNKKKFTLDDSDTCLNMTNSYISLKRYNEALIICNLGSSIRKAFLGENHQSMREYLKLIAKIYTYKQKPEKSIEILLSLVDFSKKPGKDHDVNSDSFIQETYLELGFAYEATGEKIESLDYFIRYCFLANLNEIDAELLNKILDSLSNLFKANFFCIGIYNDEIGDGRSNLYKEGLKISESIIETGKIAINDSYGKIFWENALQNYLNKNFSLAEISVRISSALLEDNYIALFLAKSIFEGRESNFNIMFATGMNDRLKGDNQTAIEKFSTLIQKVNKKDLNYYSKLSKIYLEIGNCYLSINDHTSAFKSFEDCLEMMFKQDDQYSEQNADTLFYIGSLYVLLFNSPKYDHIFEQSIEIYSRKKIDSKVAEVYKFLASQSKGRLELCYNLKSLRYYLKCLDSFFAYCVAQDVGLCFLKKNDLENTKKNYRASNSLKKNEFAVDNIHSNPQFVLKSVEEKVALCDRNIDL